MSEIDESSEMETAIGAHGRSGTENRTLALRVQNQFLSECSSSLSNDTTFSTKFTNVDRAIANHELRLIP